MCNDYRLLERVPAELLFPGVLAPEGIPNFEPRADIRITDRAPILRAATGQEGAVELVQRRWSWPGPGGKPVFNYRADGRDFPSRSRCIILADGFYEFTRHVDPKSKTKHKWLFTLRDHAWFGIAGLWRVDEKVGEAFAMLTIEPHPDVAPYHDRGIPILGRDDMARWLDPAAPAREVLKPLPAGSLVVTQIA